MKGTWQELRGFFRIYGPCGAMQGGAIYTSRPSHSVGAVRTGAVWSGFTAESRERICSRPAEPAWIATSLYGYICVKRPIRTAVQSWERNV